LQKRDDPVDSKEDKALTFIEFIELVCRVASVLGLSISSFIKDKLIPLLRWKHTQLWATSSKRGDSVAQDKD